MYSPPYNRLEDRAELIEFMRANSFVLLVTGTGGALHASHLPAQVSLEGDKIVLDMHMARNNPQWREFFDEEVLVVFSGPHAYVSPRWYEEKERVPTWNYAAVHAYGIPKIVNERSAKHESQRRLVAMLDPQWLPEFDGLRAQLDGLDVRLAVQAAQFQQHLGLVGPRILDFGQDQHDVTRAALRDNPDTWLSFTDLVMIDPIGTGWSRAVKGEDGKHFWSVRSDAVSPPIASAAEASSAAVRSSNSAISLERWRNQAKAGCPNTN